MPTKVSKRPEYALISELLRSVRETSGVSQSELARRLKRGQAYIYKIENGLQCPDILEFLDIGEVLKIDILDLLDKAQIKDVDPKAKSDR